MADENKCETGSPVNKVIDHIDQAGWKTLTDAVAFVIKWGGLGLVLALATVAALAEFAVLFLYSWNWLINKYPFK